MGPQLEPGGILEFQPRGVYKDPRFPENPGEIPPRIAKVMVKGERRNVSEIVQKVLAGDKLAYGEIVREYGPMIRVYLSSYIRDHHRVEDLSQEVFVAAYWTLKSYDPACDFRAWLNTIARNKLMSHLRSHYSRKNSVHRLTVDIYEMLMPTMERCNPDANAVLERMRDCLAKHPEKDRRLIEARYDDEESVSGIAERLGTTVSAVSSQLHRIRIQLRRCIEKGVAL